MNKKLLSILLVIAIAGCFEETDATHFDHGPAKTYSEFVRSKFMRCRMSVSKDLLNPFARAAVIADCLDKLPTELGHLEVSVRNTGFGKNSGYEYFDSVEAETLFVASNGLSYGQLGDEPIWTILSTNEVTSLTSSIFESVNNEKSLWSQVVAGQVEGWYISVNNKLMWLDRHSGLVSLVREFDTGIESYTVLSNLEIAVVLASELQISNNEVWDSVPLKFAKVSSFGEGLRHRYIFELNQQLVVVQSDPFVGANEEERSEFVRIDLDGLQPSKYEQIPVSISTSGVLLEDKVIFIGRGSMPIGECDISVCTTGSSPQNKSYIVATEAKNFSQYETTETEALLAHGPIVVDGKIYVGTREGTVELVPSSSD